MLAAVWNPERFAAEVGAPLRCSDRGVCAGLTTPALFGARLRVGLNGLEVLIPNPSGGAGWLVVPWPAAVEAFIPTVADRMLAAALTVEEVTLERLSAAAMTVAKAGFAGRPVLRAAEASQRGAHDQHALIAAQLEHRRSGGSLLLPLFADAGLHGDGAMDVRRAGRILEFAQGLLSWRGTCPSDDDRGRAALLAEKATAIAEAASRLIVATRALAADLVGLLDLWRSDKKALLAFAHRPQWVMDGWDLLASLWRATEEEARQSVLRRIIALVPPAASEVLTWPGCSGLGTGPHARSSPSALCAIDTPLCEAALCDWFYAA